MIIFMVALSAAPAVHATEKYAFLDIKLLNQNPDPAEPGNYVELRWKIEKRGSEEYRDLEFLLEPEYPFFFDARDKPERMLGDWTGYSEDEEFFTLFYELRVDEDALEGTYAVTLKYRDSNNPTWKEEEFDVRVGDPMDPEFVLGTLATSPRKLVSDTDEAEIHVELENIGDGNARNAKAEIVLPEGFTPSYVYADRDNLGTVQAGGSKTAVFYADIAEGVQAGVYETSLNVSYLEEDDDNEYRSIVLPIDIHVMDRPLFDIADVSMIPETVRPGQSAEVTLVIKNVGTKEAESVSLRAFKESSQPFEFDEKSDFVGKLEPDDEGEALLKFTVDDDAGAKKYIVDLEIRSIDNDEVVIQDKSMTIEVLADNRNPLVKVLLSPLGIVIILGGIGFFVWKKLTAKK